MPEGTLLPPVAAKPANLAAPSAGAAAPEDAETAAGPTFGEVLKERMSGADPAQSPPAAEAPAVPVSEAESAPADGVAELLSMFADAGSAAAIVPAAVMPGIVRRVVDDAASAGEPAGRLPGVSLEGLSKTVIRSENGEGTGDAKGRSVDTHAEPATARREFDHLVPKLDREAGDVEALAATKVTRSAIGAADDLRIASQPQAATMPVGATDAARSVEQPKAADAAGVRTAVAVPVGDEGWGDAMANRVTWVVQSRAPSAELQLNPPHLGPVEVRVSMSGDQASVSFFSPHAPVREALQAAVPRLTEAFAASGVALGDVFVGADARSGQQSSDGRSGQGRRDRQDSASSPVTGLSTTRWSTGLTGVRAVDLFA